MEVGFEDAGEAHDGDVDIELGEGLGFADDFGDAGDGFDEFDDGILDPTSGFAAHFFGDAGGVAAEEDGIAHALLGVEENAFAIEGGAVPLGAIEAAVSADHAGMFPAPFVFGPGVFEAAHEDEDDGFIEVEDGAIGIEGDGAVELDEGEFGAAGAGVGVGEALIKGGRGADGEDALHFGDAFIEAARSS